ncbi:MAG: pantoate--beta-alanine ligase [Vulcanimicrobiaceae bacterium]
MERVTTSAQLHKLVLERPLGFVPTMGALHDGHLALVRASRERLRTTVVSIFVNPLQFAPHEDLARYPRDIEGDCAKLEAAGADVVYLPSVDEMYPSGFSTTIDVGALVTVYEGAVRPTHFRGVATVVAKLLNIVRPDELFLGQKDAQQTAVLRTMIRDLSIPAAVRIVPTVRESDGLAMSSRNVYLNATQRTQAVGLHAMLLHVRDAMQQGISKDAACRTARGAFAADAEIDYVDVVDALTFAPLQTLAPPYFVIGAARFGSTRLLDNVMGLE